MFFFTKLLNKFSRPNGRISPRACPSYLESLCINGQFKLSGNHPTRRQIFAGKSDSTFYNIWDLVICWIYCIFFLICWICWICWFCPCKALPVQRLFSCSARTPVCTRSLFTTNASFATLVCQNMFCTCSLGVFVSVYSEPFYQKCILHYSSLPKYVLQFLTRSVC